MINIEMPKSTAMHFQFQNGIQFIRQRSNIPDAKILKNTLKQLNILLKLEDKPLDKQKMLQKQMDKLKQTTRRLPVKH
ncbi:unnamed protein product [Paramecium sonneborni]|uniref:Uncharacterized protein n=1 Tax=Paramecium sonneborni TaxID=65129 RepID=A0A8S1JV55_9CILI|nr:unnamed protein product [Paramecium sonneborni]